MANLKSQLGGACAMAFALAFSDPALAQETAGEPADETTALGQDAAPEVNPDEMADMLNAQQQIQQSYTFTRTINGEVVDEEKRTITYSRNDPVRATEAGVTRLEDLKAAFDSEVLTRNEAFEEAKLDFVIADQDRDGVLTADEFAGLVETWRANEARAAPAPDEETARQRQYRAFVAELDPQAAQMQADARAKEKFNFMAGASAALTREDYLREYLLDFDSMDLNEDMLLKGDELLRFRALNRGETIDM